MKSRSHSPSAIAAACIACLFFLVAGHLFAPLIGIEDDEALFAEGIYHPRGELYSIPAGAARIPVMLMTYLGALKTWIYIPVFKLFAPGLRSLREPMVVAGALSIFLFFLLLRRIGGDRTALIGCGLLATDSIYLLTTVYDWGPVALQHLLIVGGVLLFIRFYQTQSSVALAGGAFLLGLVLWDKALAMWMLSGLGVAVLLTFPRQILAVTTRKRLAIAASAFVLGALPLLVYNVDSHWATFRGNFQRETTANLGGKARFLMITAEGTGLFGFMNFEDWQTKNPHEPQGAVQRASARISELAGRPRQHLLFYAFLLAVLIAPLAGWRTLRLVLFGLIALAVAWIQMAINANTGGSVHHTVLLWPLPQFIVAVSFAGVSRRLGRAGVPLVSTVVAVIAVSGMLVINEYHIALIRFGGSAAWTDGILNLSDYMKTLPAKKILCMDWGILDQLRLLSHGKLPLGMGSDQISKAEMSEQDRADILKMISDPANVFVAHTKDFGFFPDSHPKLIKFAGESGLATETIKVVPDRYGRDVYEVYRFR